MTPSIHKAVAIVGVGAVLPDAPDVPSFWSNVSGGRYSISDVPKERWDEELYYDPDPKAPDKSYSRIGGWVREFDWDPLKWRLPIPPRVSDQMDRTQKWAIMGARQALLDYGYPERPLDPERTAVILGSAMGGDRHYLTSLRILFPEVADELAQASSFEALPAGVRGAILEELRAGVGRRLPEINEDTMPGELANIIAGRIANVFDFHGPNFVVDAACASAMAGLTAAIEGLEEHHYDAVLSGGIDANMGASTFIKFCKIGALSATGTRPFADGADGFVMGEGAAVFLLKRLADAERDGDRVYAVFRGIGGSSDGKGKGITAPNPIGQKLAVERAWRHANRVPGPTTLIEGHGTSTKVGDVVEVESISEVFRGLDLPPGSIPLGSVKSNIGHLKGAAGAAGILKAALALHHKMLPPSLNFSRPNPNIDFSSSPFYVNTELREWEVRNGDPRRVGVSAFGFGGTNFHTVLEEYVPGMGAEDRPPRVAMTAATPVMSAAVMKAPRRGALVLGAASEDELMARLEEVAAEAQAGRAPEPAPPDEAALRAPERLTIDYGDAAELAAKASRAARAGKSKRANAWAALSSQGIYRGRGEAGKVAFLYTGQGSQYLNMLAEVRRLEPVVEETFAEADRVMKPLLGKPLSELIFLDSDDEAAIAQATDKLRQTEITQPAVLTVDVALTRLLATYGLEPDMVMGHSLGEYGALVAAGCLSFAEALEAVSARGQEMAKVLVTDQGEMAAVTAPLEEIEATLAKIDGYIVVANINSSRQAVIGGATPEVEQAIAMFQEKGYDARKLQVSHAFHTEIVAPASAPLMRLLRRFHLKPPALPVVSNVTGTFYPAAAGRPEDAVRDEMIALLGRQIASPVQFVKGLETLYDAGARVFVEVGPKRALSGFVRDVFGDREDVAALFTNHPRSGDVASFNQALCGFWAAGVGVGRRVETPAVVTVPAASPAAFSDDQYRDLGRLVTELIERGLEGRGGGAPRSAERPVTITGAALGLPGPGRLFDERNVERILSGAQLIDVIPTRLRQKMLDKNVTRLVKHDGNPRFETISNPAEVIKLAGRRGDFDLVEEYGFPEDRRAALDVTTEMAIAAGLDALRDAGIPLVMRYKRTSLGTFLPERFMLPEELRDSTGVIFASAFPGSDYFAAELERYHEDRARRVRLAELRDLRARIGAGDPLAVELDRRVATLEDEVEREAYSFDRRFLFRLLAMGHSQFAEYIGARGPNTQMNAACASTSQAVSMAEDWIRQGRCRRVVVISADDVTSDHLMEWIGAGFLASGAAATDEVVEEAALPFDRRRHGMLVGMGAAALVVEDAAAAAERGLRPICEVLSTVTRNSAFHGTRLDVEHICGVMESLVADAEQRWGIRRDEIAPHTVFVSHETYTPARGGSASAEIHALRRVFDGAADRIVIANTKGFTGHPMAVGIEDVVAVKALETGVVPPVPNFREVDPELGNLNLSRGGAYPVRYALRLAAGFGSQISLTLCRWTETPDGRRPLPNRLGYATRVADPAVWQAWLDRLSGYDGAELEVERRTLRIKDRGAPAGLPAAEVVRPAVVVPAPAPVVVAAPPPPPAPEPPPPPAPEPSPPVAAVPAEDPVKVKVLQIVAEKTGYPPDMLDLDLDLEADLGVDTVKQAETFAAIRAAYDIPRDDNLVLRDYPTLQHAIGFVYEKRPDLTRPGASAPPPPPPAPVAEPTPAAAVEDDSVRVRVLEIVAEKTGYPPDMLDLDLDLEADLGVDTVKQAETFAAIRAAYDIPRDDNLVLRDYPTLAHAIGFVFEKRPDLQGGAAPATAEEAETAPEEPEPAAAVPRRVPTPVLRPPIAATKATGVVLEAGRRVVLAPDEGGVGKALAGRLRKRGVEVLVLEDGDEPAEQVAAWKDSGPIDGVYWLPALDDEGDPLALDRDAWRAALDRRLKRLYETVRALYDDLGKAGAFLVSATRLGGLHGYGEDGATAPLGGAVTGFTKTVKRERPEALVKAVDFAASRKTSALADILIAETESDPGAVEIGTRDDRRYAIGLAEEAAPEASHALGPETVYVVTGAAGSIVSAIVADLAASGKGGVFHLLDLAPEPDPKDPDLALYESDRDALKRRLFERLKASGERATPAKVDRELAGYERRQAALQAIEAIRRAGGEARYHQVDLLDGKAVAQVASEIRQGGRVDVLIHAAGLEISHMLPDKERREFDLVFDVKADGFFHLVKGLGDVPIGAVMGFSSIAGRFGNGGQTDYASANDLLCKLASSFRRTRPETRAVAIDWTAWGGIGMATRGSIPKMMELAGIDMLPPDAGIAIVSRELRSGFRGEVVIAQGLGVLLEEFDATGGLDPAKLATEPRPMAGVVTAMGLYSGLVVETTLDPKEQPFLFDHQIDATPVLPGVMGIEAFAEAARLAAPDWHLASVDDVSFLQPFKFYRGEPRTVRVEVVPYVRGGEVVALGRLVGTRQLPKQDEPQVTTHFTARVRLTATPPADASRPRPQRGEHRLLGKDAIYRVYFHGPAYQVLESAWGNGDATVGLYPEAMPENHVPKEHDTLMAPRLVELCFQTAGLRELGRTGKMGLPQRVARVRRLPNGAPPEGRLQAIVEAKDGGFSAWVVDDAGRVYVELDGYATIELPGGAKAEDLEPFKVVVG